MSEPLEILVVEDNERYQLAARWLLRNHRVTIACNFNEAVRKLVGAENQKYPPMELSGKTSKYNIVLSDMNFPLGGTQAEMTCNDTQSEQPLGYSLALAASRIHIPNFAIVTDLNHHSGPVAATFDFLYDKRFASTYDSTRPVFSIGEMNFMMFDSRDFFSIYLLKNNKVSTEVPERVLTPQEVEFPEDLSTDYTKVEKIGDKNYPEGYGFVRREETYNLPGGMIHENSMVKNWSSALHILLNGYPEMEGEK
jgi:hypothetical protein